MKIFVSIIKTHLTPRKKFHSHQVDQVEKVIGKMQKYTSFKAKLISNGLGIVNPHPSCIFLNLIVVANICFVYVFHY